MELDLVNADIYVAEHRRRVAAADRFGPLLPIDNANSASKRNPVKTVTIVLAISSAVRATLRRRLAARTPEARGNAVGATNLTMRAEAPHDRMVAGW